MDRDPIADFDASYTLAADECRRRLLKARESQPDLTAEEWLRQQREAERKP